MCLVSPRQLLYRGFDMQKLLAIQDGRHTSIESMVIVIGFLLFAFLGGAFLVFVGPILGGLFLVLLVGLGTSFSRSLLLYFGMLVAFLVAGISQLYYPPLAFVRWIIPVSTGMLLFHVLWQQLQARDDSLRFSWILRWAIIFLLTTLIGSIINWQSGLNFIQGFKLYFQLWGLLFGLALLKWNPDTLDRVLKLLFFIALIQLPFALHQYFFIAPEREGLWKYGVVPLDVVSGTLGADRMGGGKNMVLSMFMVAMLGGLAALWRAKAIKGYIFMLAGPLLLAPLFLNESKFALILLLVSMAYVFRRDIFQKPMRFFMIATISGVLAVGLLTTYSMTFGKGGTISETLQFAVESNIGATGYGGRVLNRLTAITFWGEKHGLDDISGTLVGHGLGASHESSESVLSSVRTLATTRYAGYGLGLSSLSSMLWDTGLVGVAAIIAMFLTAILTAHGLTQRYANDLWRCGIFEGMQAALLSAMLMLFHSHYFVVDPVFQSLVYFMFGYIAFWSIRSIKPPITAKS